MGCKARAVSQQDGRQAGHSEGTGDGSAGEAGFPREKEKVRGKWNRVAESGRVMMSMRLDACNRQIERESQFLKLG
jgi:hypothetical protein